MRKPVLLSKKVFANARLIKITIKDRYLGIRIGKQNKLIVGFDRDRLTGLTPRVRLHGSGFCSGSLHDGHLEYIAERLVKRFLLRLHAEVIR